MKRLPKLIGFIITIPYLIITVLFVTILWILGANNKRLLDVLNAVRDAIDES